MGGRQITRVRRDGGELGERKGGDYLSRVDPATPRHGGDIRQSVRGREGAGVHLSFVLVVIPAASDWLGFVLSRNAKRGEFVKVEV